MTSNIGILVPPGISEGDYTEWTLIWKRNYTDGLQGFILWQSPFIDAKNGVLNLYWTDWPGDNTRFGTYELATGTPIFESPSGSNYITMGGTGYEEGFSFGASEYGSRSFCSYVVLYRWNGTDIEVWRKGGLLQSIDITADFGATSINIIEISYDGQYILVVTHDKQFGIYKGS